MTWKDITRLQLPDCLRESLATLGQRDAQNSEVDVSNARIGRRAGNSTRVDVNPFASGFDHKCKWLAQHPVGCLHRFGRGCSSIKRNFSEKVIVFCAEDANGPRTDMLNTSRFDGAARCS